MGTRWTTRALTLGLCSGYFLVLLDVTVVNVALPRIGVALHLTSQQRAWVVDGYTVPLAAVLLASGAVGDRLGHRRVVVTGFVGFGAASVVCSLATGVWMLVAGRALQGTCAGLMLPGTLALLTEATPDARARARLVGLWAAVGAAALPAGPLLGGLVVETGGWRAVFWLNVPVVALALVCVLGASAPTAQRRSGGVDWWGSAALVVALGAAVTAVIQVGTPRPALLMVAIAVVAGGALWHVERTVEHPLLRVPGRARRPLAAACLVAGLMNLCVLGSLFLLTQVLQDVHGLGPLSAGAMLLPAMLPLSLLGPAAGRLTGAVGAWRTSALGLAVAAAGFAGIAASIGDLDHPGLLVALGAWGVGLGILTPAIVTAALQSLPGSSGTASGASNTARQAGGALGVAAFGALAGASGDVSFVPHVAWLFVGSAVAFALAAGCCLRADGPLRRLTRGDKVGASIHHDAEPDSLGE